MAFFLGRFLPRNPGLRRQVKVLSLKLTTLIESNFKRTKDLIDCIRKYISGKRFSKNRVDHDEDLRSNCRVIQSRLREITEYVEEKVSDLKRRIDGSLFDKIMSVDTSFMDKVRLAKRAVLAADVALGFTSIVVMSCIYSGASCVSVSVCIGTIATCALAGLAYGVLFLAFDALFSIFIGAEEREKQQNTIYELESILSKYDPASYKFNMDIERLIITLQDIYD